MNKKEKKKKQILQLSLSELMEEDDQNKGFIMEETLNYDFKENLALVRRVPPSITNIEQLPFDIFCDILSRLSLDLLMKLKSVSNTWRNTIKSPYLKQMLISLGKVEQEPGIVRVSHDSALGSTSLYHVKEGDEFKSVYRLPFEAESFTKYDMENTCNGLLCFYKYGGIGGREIFICNPVLDEDITLIDLPAYNSEFRRAVGLGFSPSTKEYKVVLIPVDISSTAKIHTLGTSSWRDISGLPPCPFYGKTVYANGALHWKLDTLFDYDDDVEDLIVSFDIETEKFYITDVPSTLRSVIKHEKKGLLHLRGCLAVTDPISASRIDIWMLKDKQWVKEYVLQFKEPPKLECSVNLHIPKTTDFIVIGLWQLGEILLAWKKSRRSRTSYDPPDWTDFNFCSYDLRTERLGDVNDIVRTIPSNTITKVFAYTRSLVSLKPYGYKEL